MKSKLIKKILAGLFIVLLLMVLTTTVVYHRAVYVVFKNITAGTVNLDDLLWTQGTSYEHVPYATDSSAQYLDLYIPDGADGEKPKLYVIIHGGGFITNDSQCRQALLMYRYFRDHGYACASVNYRLAQEAPFPAALSDCKAAIRFLRAHADQYGYDADHIAVFGESAGGYLAVMCGVTDDTEFMDVEFLGQDQAEEISAKVDVVVNYYGHIDHSGAEKDWAQLKIPRVIRNIYNGWIAEDDLLGYDGIDSFWFRKNISEMTP